MLSNLFLGQRQLLALTRELHIRDLAVRILAAQVCDGPPVLGSTPQKIYSDALAGAETRLYADF